MNDNEKSYSIFIRGTKERIPVTKQEFDDYYRDINAYRKKQQRHSRCVCPQSERLLCDMDCWSCPHHCEGDSVSLDESIGGDEGSTTFADCLEDNAPLIESIISDQDELAQLLSRLAEIMPEAKEIGELRLKGLTEDAIEERIGIGRKTFAYRLKRAASILAKEFPDFF